jgi:hypothetical protein
MTCKRCHEVLATIQPYWADAIELCGPCSTAVAALLDQHDKWPAVPWDDEDATR